MGHRITALVTADSVDWAQAAAYDMPCFDANGFAIIGLDAWHSDYWAEQLGIPHRNHSGIILDNDVTRFFAQALGVNRYALVSTDYFGGAGEQYATVYEAGQAVVPATRGGINAALHRIGVQRGWRTDEFDTIGLGQYRDFDDYFAKYYDLY